MITFDEAVAIVRSAARPVGVEPVSLYDAHGRILAAPVVASGSAPPVPVSAMDGYAVGSSDISPLPARLPVVGESFAGSGTPKVLPAGACMRVFTGAPVPIGSERVIVQEEVRREGDHAIFDHPASGRTHIRAAGSDFRAGDTLLAAGRRLDPQALVTAAAADLAELAVFRRPRIALLSTGDELAEPGAARRICGAIPDSVSFGVAALVETWGGQVVSRQRCADRLDVLRQRASEAVEIADIVVVTGGASVGERDFAKTMFDHLGPELLFSKVAIKPGKPIWMARVGRTFIVGLPGNPTSAMVTARLLLAPLVAGLAGRAPQEAWNWREAPLKAPIGAGGERETFCRASVNARGVLVMGDQDSASQSSLAHTDALVRRLPRAAAAEVAEPVQYIPL